MKWNLLSCIMIVSLLVLLVTLSGCKSPEFSVDFKPQPKMSGLKTPIGDTLYVLTPEEGRKSGGHSTFAMEPLIALPLVPYVHEKITPESMVFSKSGFKYDFRSDLADWLVKDIKVSGIFKNVCRKESCCLDRDEKFPPKTWILKSVLTKGVWERYVTAYGLSYGCVVLWPLGLPLSYGSVTLELKVTLINASTKKVVANTTIYHKSPCMEWIYDQVPGTPSIFQRELLDLLKPTTKELRVFLIKNIKK